MTITKFRKRLALMLATVSAMSPMTTFASTAQSDGRHKDITSFTATGPESTTTDWDWDNWDTTEAARYTTHNFQLLEDAVLDAINLMQGTQISTKSGTDITTTQTWASKEDKELYDVMAADLLSLIQNAQTLLTKLNNDYADMDTELNKTTDGNFMTTPGLLHAEEVFDLLGQDPNSDFSDLFGGSGSGGSTGGGSTGGGSTGGGSTGGGNTGSGNSGNLFQQITNLTNNINTKAKDMREGFGRSAGSSLSYNSAKDILDEAIEKAEALLATTSGGTVITDDMANGVAGVTTGKTVRLSTLDGDDVTSGTAWLSQTNYDALSAKIKEAKDLLDRVYGKSTTPAATYTDLVDMAKALYGVDATTPNDLKLTTSTAIDSGWNTSAYKQFLTEVDLQDDDGDIIKARKQMKYLLLDAQANLVQSSTKPNCTTVDDLDVNGVDEDNDGDNTYVLKDVSDNNAIIYMDDDDYVTTGTNVTTATVTHIHKDDPSREGATVWGSWVTTADWNAFAGILDSVTKSYMDLDGSVGSKETPSGVGSANYSEYGSTFTTGTALNYSTTASYTFETNKDTQSKIEDLFDQLNDALDAFKDAYQEGQLEEITKEKVKLLEAIDEAQEERGWITDTGHTTDTAVVLPNNSYKADANPVTSSALNGTDINSTQAWVSEDVWNTFNTALETAITTYNSIKLNLANPTDTNTGIDNNEMSVSDVENAIDKIKEAMRAFERELNDEGLKEEYEEVMGGGADPNNEGLKDAISAARTSTAGVTIEDGKVTTGYISTDGNSVTTVQVSHVGGADISSDMSWATEDDYKEFLEIVEEAEDMRDKEDTRPSTATAGALVAYEIDDIEDMTNDLNDATEEFYSEKVHSGKASEKNQKLENLETLITTATDLVEFYLPSEYGGLDFLTTTAKVVTFDDEPGVTTTNTIATYKADGNKFSTTYPGWVTETQYEDFYKDISEAQYFKQTTNANTTIESLDEIIADLTEAINTFKDDIEPASTSKYELFKLIYGEEPENGGDFDGQHYSGYIKDLFTVKRSDVNGGDIPTGEQWVTNAQHAAFRKAVDTAMVVLDNPTIKPGRSESERGTVKNAVRILQDAKSKFMPSAGTGFLIPHKNDLADEINTVKYMIFETEDTYVGDRSTPSGITTQVYVSSDHGKSLRTTAGASTTRSPLNEELWVTDTQRTAFKKQIDTAERAWKNTKPSQTTLNTAENNLVKQKDLFLTKTAQKAMATADYNNLEASFNTLLSTTNTALSTTIKESRLGGADISSTATWAIQSDINVLKKAVETAKKIYDDRNDLSAAKVKEAYETLLTATKNFDDNKLHMGYRDRWQDDLWGDIEVARTDLGNVERSEVYGVDIPTDEVWMEARDYDTFKRAIDTAERTIEINTVDKTTDGEVKSNFNQATFKRAEATLETAKDKFSKVTTHEGLGTLAPVKQEYINTMNLVNALIGKDQISAITTPGDITTSAAVSAEDAVSLLQDFDLRGAKGIRESKQGNGVDVSEDFLWLPSSSFNAISQVINTNILNYVKPNLNIDLTEIAMDNLVQKNIPAWLKSAKGPGTKEDVAAARSTLASYVTTAYSLIGKTVITSPTGFSFIDATSNTARPYATSDQKGTDISVTTAWASSAHDRTFDSAITKAETVYENTKSDVRTLTAAKIALEKAITIFEGYDANENGVIDRGDYAQQRFENGSREIIATSKAALTAQVERANTTRPMLKISSLGTGADVSKDHVLVSGLKRTGSNLPILTELNTAFIKANTISKARDGAYTYEDIAKATETLETLLDVIKDAPKGNKEDTLQAKTALKSEIDAANRLLRETVSHGTKKGKEGNIYYASHRNIYALKALVKKASSTYSNRYASVNGSSYTMQTDGTVRENPEGATINRIEYEKIGRTTSDGIRLELYNATRAVIDDRNSNN